jgi:hypothetical protein
MNEHEARTRRILAAALEKTRAGDLTWVRGSVPSAFRTGVGGGILRIVSRDKDGAAPFLFEVAGRSLREVVGTLSSEDTESAALIQELYIAILQQMEAPSDAVFSMLEQALGIADDPPNDTASRPDGTG